MCVTKIENVEPASKTNEKKRKQKENNNVKVLF